MTEATIDYVPYLNGAPYDPAPEGGSVLALTLLLNGNAVLTAGPAVRVAPNRYRFTFEEPAAGTYAAHVSWKETAAASPFQDTDEVVVFPLPVAPAPPLDGMVVSVEEVARRAGYALPLSPAGREAIEEAILDAQSDVEAHLGRPIVPTLYTDHGLWAHGETWAVTETPLVRIVSVATEFDTEGSPLGTFTVGYLAGLDGANDPNLRPIRRYVKAHAAALARQVPAALSASITRSIRAVNVEGQGITYGDDIGVLNATGPGSGAVGSLPTLKSLDRWRLAGRRVFQRAGSDYDMGGTRFDTFVQG